MEQLSLFQVMATHTLHYRGEEGTVDVVQVTREAPSFFFRVHFSNREILLCRVSGRPELWNSMQLGHQEAKALGQYIEQQIGYQLPSKADNNPFQYQGDIEVVVERLRMEALLIERAKAPYTHDVYYRIVFSESRSVVLVRKDGGGGGQWRCEGVCRLEENAFQLFKSMLVHVEEAYQLRMMQRYTESWDLHLSDC